MKLRTRSPLNSITIIPAGMSMRAKSPHPWIALLPKVRRSSSVRCISTNFSRKPDASLAALAAAWSDSRRSLAVCASALAAAAAACATSSALRGFSSSTAAAAAAATATAATAVTTTTASASSASATSLASATNASLLASLPPEALALGGVVLVSLGVLALSSASKAEASKLAKKIAAAEAAVEAAEAATAAAAAAEAEATPPEAGKISKRPPPPPPHIDPPPHETVPATPKTRWLCRRPRQSTQTAGKVAANLPP
mmetsp:Transcript_9986/g.32727  ORF Transcript_9986/g.32727 Transcript_9986/m.32727 type:complete len:256 (-) Transcript_9986:413-1180(-)